MEEGRLEGLQTGRQEGLLEGRQEGLLAGRQEGLLEGRQEGETSVLLRLLERRCGMLPGDVRQAIRTLPQDQRLVLADAVLEVRGLEDLQRWLGDPSR